jgi:beta-1,4-mannosyl-glycoprotein beta-1,4-N-acetylglucosaminyltransferase
LAASKWVPAVAPEVRLFLDRLNAFEAGVEDADQAYVRDRSGFLERLERYSADNDTARFLALAQVPLAHGDFDVRLVKQLRRRLILQNRFEDALALFSDPRAGGKRDQLYHLEHAQVLEGAGRWEDAIAAVDEALAIEPDWPRALELKASLKQLVQVRRGLQAPPPWADVKRLLDHWLSRGHAPQARDALCDLLDRGHFLELAPEVIAGARALMPSLDADAALGLLSSLARLNLSATDAAALDRFRQGEGVIAETAGDDMSCLLAEAAAALDRRPAAIRTLARLASDPARAEKVRLPLARLIGDDNLTAVRFGPRGVRRPRKIFDLFPMNDELELLKIKLHEMSPWVDHFVVVESAQTFTGHPKPLHFKDNRELFKAFEAKIIHVTIEQTPDYVCGAWAREFLQRDLAMRTLAPLCQDDDLVLLSDVDEVLDHRALDGFDGEYASLKTQTFMYFLNYRQVLDRDAQRGNASIWRAGHLRRIGASYARNMLCAHKVAPRIYDAGWHFTSVGSAIQLANKMKSYSHAEYAHKDDAFFQHRIAKIMRGEPDPRWERWEIDDRFPAFVRENRSSLADLILG